MAVIQAVKLAKPAVLPPASLPQLSAALSAPKGNMWVPAATSAVAGAAPVLLTRVVQQANPRIVQADRIASHGTDLFRGVLFEPITVALGALNGTVTYTFKVRNAYLVPVSIAAVEATGLSGVTLDFGAGFALARTQERLVTLTATMDGPAQINGSFAITFTGEGVSFVAVLPVTGFRTQLMLTDPSISRTPEGKTSINWGERVVVSYGYKTDIFTSRAQREQRRSIRHNPRIVLEFQLSARRGDAPALDAYLEAEQRNSATMLDPTDAVTLALEAASGSPTVQLEATPTWLGVGALLGLPSLDGGMTLHTVTSVAGFEVGIAPTAQAIYPAGSKLHRAHTGYLATSLTARNPTSAVTLLAMRFEVKPPAGDRADPPAAQLVHNGLEVFVKRANWGETPQTTYESLVERVDYDRGAFEQVEIVPHGARSTTWGFTCRDRNAAFELRDFFDRVRGMRGEFYMPTWKRDFELIGQMESGTAFFVAAGEHQAEHLSGSSVFRRIIIMLRDGTFLIRQVSGMVAVDGQTTVTLSESFTSTITADQIIMVSWLPRCRLASDTLTLSWLTGGVCTTSLTMRTLEDDD